MEKILERYWKDDVFKVIDKHIEKHDKMIDEVMEKKVFYELFIDKNESIEKEIENDLQAPSGAIAALILLKKELNGEVDYGL